MVTSTATSSCPQWPSFKTLQRFRQIFAPARILGRTSRTLYVFIPPVDEALRDTAAARRFRGQPRVHRGSLLQLSRRSHERAAAMARAFQTLGGCRQGAQNPGPVVLQDGGGPHHDPQDIRFTHDLPGDLHPACGSSASTAICFTAGAHSLRRSLPAGAVRASARRGNETERLKGVAKSVAANMDRLPVRCPPRPRSGNCPPRSCSTTGRSSTNT